MRGERWHYLQALPRLLHGGGEVLTLQARRAALGQVAPVRGGRWGWGMRGRGRGRAALMGSGMRCEGFAVHIPAAGGFDARHLRRRGRGACDDGTGPSPTVRGPDAARFIRVSFHRHFLHLHLAGQPGETETAPLTCR